jgi:hypothetical protein
MSGDLQRESLLGQDDQEFLAMLLLPPACGRCLMPADLQCRLVERSLAIGQVLANMEVQVIVLPSA